MQKAGAKLERKGRKRKVMRKREVKCDVAPSSIAAKMTTKIPVSKQGPRSIRIVHRELVGTVSSTSDVFNVAPYNLNPGDPQTFPWLHVQAQAWEQYRFHKLVFEFVTRSPTTTPGSVFLVPDYDSSDAPPLSEQKAMSYQGAVENAPWTNFSCALVPASMHSMGQRKYTRTGAHIGDVRTSDVGVMYVGTAGTPIATLGKLWVSYDVELFVPQLPISGLDNNALTRTEQSIIVSPVGAPIVALPIGNVVADKIGLKVSSDKKIITVPPGDYLQVVAVELALGDAAVPSNSNLTVKDADSGAVIATSNSPLYANGTTSWSMTIALALSVATRLITTLAYGGDVGVAPVCTTATSSIYKV